MIINNNYLFNFVMRFFPYHINDFTSWDKILEAESYLKRGEIFFIGDTPIKMVNGKYKIVSRPE